MRVIVTRRLPIELPSGWDVWPHDGPPQYDMLRELASEADGILCLLTDRVDAVLINGAPKLKVISQMAVGVDNVDLDAATARGIPVGHTPGVLAETTADLTWALILAASRRIGEGERFVRDRRWTTWSPDLLLGMDVGGATLGIVGAGAIGRAVARRASGFGMTVCYWSPHSTLPDATRLELAELLERSDVVTLHVALTPETRKLIGRRELALMKPTSVLVNASRGGVLDEDALIAALRDRRLFAAGLDVYATEPLPHDSPLLALENVVLVPHLGSASVATRGRMARIAVDNLTAGLRGERLPSCANPLVYRGSR